MSSFETKNTLTGEQTSNRFLYESNRFFVREEDGVNATCSFRRNIT